MMAPCSTSALIGPATSWGITSVVQTSREKRIVDESAIDSATHTAQMKQMPHESPPKQTADAANIEPAAQSGALNARDFSTQQTLQFTESATEGRPGLRILEVGCGRGHLAKALVDMGHSVLPIDISEEAVAFARSLGLSAKQTDIFGIKDSKFDCVLFARSLHHITPLDESLRQAALLLDEGGFVVLEDFDFTKMDEKTAVWLRGVQNTLSTVGIAAAEHFDIGNAFRDLMNYYSEHRLHTGKQLIEALRNVFRKVEISEGGPWLYSSFVPRAESQAKGYELIEAIFEWEQFQIEKGFIQGLGLRAIAFR
jgi:2-polyprenyl-3-methyl-5-hydroxy-6-metoxy-1,4-benzoquinol methylase